MPADLTSAGLFHREAFLIDDDCLVVLEAGFSSDRVRRIGYDRVESVVVWSQMAGGRQFFGIVMAAFGFVMGLSELVVGWFVAVVGAAIFARFALCRKYTIRITRAGRRKDICCTRHPAPLHRFVERLCAAIDAAQNHAIAKAESRAPASASDPAQPTS